MRISTLLQIQPNLDLGRLRFRSDGVSELTFIIPFVLFGILLIGMGIGVYFYLRRR